MSTAPEDSIRIATLKEDIVLLRPMKAGDAEDLVKSVDARMIEFTTLPVSRPQEYTLPMAEEFISRGKAEKGVLRWALTEPAKFGNRYCGNIEFRYDSRSHDPHQGSLGYNTSPWARSRGLQSRAVRLVTKYLFSQGFHRI